METPLHRLKRRILLKKTAARTILAFYTRNRDRKAARAIQRWARRRVCPDPWLKV